MPRTTLLFSLLFLLCSSAWSADLPKYYGTGVTCEKFAYPGGTLTDFWEYVEAEQGGDKEFSEAMLSGLKAEINELESMMIWTTPEVERWSRLFIANRVHQGIARERPQVMMTVQKLETMNYVIAVWKEIGFATAEGFKACDADNPDHKRRVWTPADWNSDVEKSPPE